MISAREAFASIDRALQGVRKDEDRILAMLKSATDEAERLRRTQADGYKALARLKLDALARDEIVGKLDGAEKRALDALRGRRAALDDLSVGRRAQTVRMAYLEAARLAGTA